MLTMGISGGLDRLHQHRPHLSSPVACHDSAAALAEDGLVVAAIEEERLNRIKHTSKGPVHAIRSCLRSRSASLDDLDHLVFYGSEETCDAALRQCFYTNVDARPVRTMRELLHEMLLEGVGDDIDDGKLKFVHHHLAHAISSHMQSGCAESLVVTLDGMGDGLSGSVTHWRETEYRTLRLLGVDRSLGTLYDMLIPILGYGFTEEYKVMGLAPYGDAERHAGVFAELYTLLPEGDYQIHWDRVPLLYSLAPARKKGEPTLQEHLDLAAGIQKMTEALALHLIGYFRSATNLTTLCLAGGVAHNSTLNGRLLCSGMFKDIFVQPASHDAGCAIGAALAPFVGASSAGVNGSVHRTRPGRIEHTYWGSEIGSDDDIAAALERWGAVIEFEAQDNIAARAAGLLAGGRVIGWAQGRSEFGPRALGNRSILADPRPAHHKDLINQMVKKREAFRPFAPSVLEESAAEWFEIPVEGMAFPWMSFTLQVRPERRKELGATTHVDGSARVQTVSARTNPRFWELINEFGKATGVPIVLNTSFNNNAEPIVDSVDDAVACFLTTGLNDLVVGGYLVRKTEDAGVLARLGVTMLPQARLVQLISRGPGVGSSREFFIETPHDGRRTQISEAAHALLAEDARIGSIGDRLAELDLDTRALFGELWRLWSERVIVCRPLGVVAVTEGTDREGWRA